MVESLTYIKNTKYQFILIHLMYNSPENIQKSGFTIYKQTYEINIINEDNINILLNSNYNFIESKANIGFFNISGILCFLYSTNNDLKEKGKIEGKSLIYKIKDIEYIPLAPILSQKEKNDVNKEFNRIKKFLIDGGFYFSTNPIRLDIEMKGQMESFKNSNIKYKLLENFQYNHDFFPSAFKNIITPIIKGYHKTFSYNNAQNEKVSMSITIRNKVFETNIYLMEIELFVPPTQNNQEVFQIIFYAYFNDSTDKIGVLKNLADKWIKFLMPLNLYKPNQRLGLIINFNNISNDSNYHDMKNLSDFEIYNLNKIKKLENTLNKFDEAFKSIGYNYQNKNVDYEFQNRLLILMSDDLKFLFSVIEIVASIFFSIFLQDRNYKTNILNNNKDEIIKRLKTAGKKIKVKDFKNKITINEVNDSNYNMFNKNNINKINEEINSNNFDKNQITEEINNNFITLFIGTYNVNALSLNLIKSPNISSFIFPEALNENFTEKNYPTFYCIGLEEIVELNAKNILVKASNNTADSWEERISSELQSKFNYYLVCKEQLVGILLLFYVKATEIKYMKNIKIEKLKSGFMGYGNKGCCILNFEYQEKNYGFCSSHLPSGEKEKNLTNRKDTFNHILSFKLGDIEFSKNDFFFIFGDLNFRTSKIGLQNLKNHLKIMSTNKKPSEDNIRGSLQFDKKKSKPKVMKRLKSEMIFSKHPKSVKIDDFIYIEKIDEDIKEKNDIDENLMDEKIFTENFMNDFSENEELKKFEKNDLNQFGIIEAEIKFPPTYKFKKNTNSYNISKRVPSWTDRILFKNNEYIKPLEYDKIDINLSDHKPIFGLFEIKIK